MLNLTPSQIATLIAVLSSSCDDAGSEHDLANRIGEDNARRAMELHSDLFIQFGQDTFDAVTMEIILDET